MRFFNDERTKFCIAVVDLVDNDKYTIVDKNDELLDKVIEYDINSKFRSIEEANVDVFNLTYSYIEESRRCIDLLFNEKKFEKKIVDEFAYFVTCLPSSFIEYVKDNFNSNNPAYYYLSMLGVEIDEDVKDLFDKSNLDCCSKFYDTICLDDDFYRDIKDLKIFISNLLPSDNNLDESSKEKFVSYVAEYYKESFENVIYLDLVTDSAYKENSKNDLLDYVNKNNINLTKQEVEKIFDIICFNNILNFRFNTFLAADCSQDLLSKNGFNYCYEMVFTKDYYISPDHEFVYNFGKDLDNMEVDLSMGGTTCIDDFKESITKVFKENNYTSCSTNLEFINAINRVEDRNGLFKDCNDVLNSIDVIEILKSTGTVDDRLMDLLVESMLCNVELVVTEFEIDSNDVFAILKYYGIIIKKEVFEEVFDNFISAKTYKEILG